MIGGLEDLFQDVTAGISQLVAQLGAQAAGDVHSQHSSLEWVSGPQHHGISFNEEQYHRDAMSEAFSSHSADYHADAFGQVFEQSAVSSARDALGQLDGHQTHDIWHSEVSPFNSGTAHILFSQDDMLAALSGGDDALFDAQAEATSTAEMAHGIDGEPMAAMLTGLMDQGPSMELFSA